MKIELKNFKCWNNNTFEIPDDGIVLLSAESGTGKSSLLDAITWVLFGNTKSTLSLGSTSGHVKLWYDNIYVYRSKRPNRLVVKYDNKEYEDDPAQFKIEEIFGCNFEIVSYIKQDNTTSFSRLSPSEKTEFIEKSLFQNTNIKQMKTRTKELIKERETKLAELQSTLSTLEKFPVTKPILTRFPISCEPSKYTETVVKYNKLLEQSDSKLKQLSQKIDMSSSEKTSKEMEAEINEKQKHLDYFTDQYDEKLKEINNIHINESELEKLLSIKNNLDKYRDKCRLEKELKTTEQQIQEIEEEKKDIKNKLTDIQEGIEDELESLNEYIQVLKQKQKIEGQLHELKEVTEEGLSLLKKQQEQHDLKSGINVSCPECSTELVFVNSKLCYKSEGHETRDLRRDIEKYEQKIIKKKMFEKELNKVSEQYEEWPEEDLIQEELVFFREQIQTKNELKSRLRRLENKNTSADNKLFLKQREIKSSLETYKDIAHVDTNESDIIKKISDIELEKHTKTRLSRELTSLSDKNNGLVTDIAELRKISRYIVNRENELKQLQEQHDELVEKKEKYQKITSQMVKWEKSQEELCKWEKYNHEITKTRSELEIIRDKLESVYTLKTRLTEAESICTSNFINVLNTHTQDYTDSFFKNNSITVNLQRQKTSKKGTEKPQLNISVNYKGNETDMGILSGGEKDRIDLAFTLALSEVFKSKILLLDECISSLDHSNSECVIEGLRDLYKGKLVIVVAHQVNEGLFDHVIKLN
jgi:exonuclease SbcC